MHLRSLLLAALGGALMLSAAAPAYADRDDHDHGGPRHHEEHRWHGDRDWDHRGYYAPPVVVGPPAYSGYYAPPPVYYAPPPAYYGPPGVSLGFTIR
jgi:hypothetical protein